MMNKKVRSPVPIYLRNAPAGLVLTHKAQLKRRTDSEFYFHLEKITRALITHPSMGPAWDSLTRAFNRSDAKFLYERSGHDWTQSILSAVVTCATPLSELSQFDKGTHVERQTKICAASKSALTLANLIADGIGGLDQHFFDLLTLPGILSVDRIKSLQAAGIHDPEWLHADVFIRGFDVRMSEVLRALSVSLLEKTNEPSLLPHAGVPNPERILFIRKLAAEFQRMFGTPLYSALARITEAVFDAPEVNEDMARKIVNRTKKGKISSNPSG